jgi:deazaflavin-dependent oxidoreductase (nitroreductase family)
MTDFKFRAMDAVHRALLKVSGGRIGRTLWSMPVVELHTVGRKSGEPRNTMLTAPLVEDGRYVLVASKGGEPRNPAWYFNLLADPNVELTVKGERLAMRARVAESAERADLWPRVVSAYPGYGGYQKKTTREIPLVICEPLRRTSHEVPGAGTGRSRS